MTCLFFRMTQLHGPPAESLRTWGNSTHSLQQKWLTSLFLTTTTDMMCYMWLFLHSGGHVFDAALIFGSQGSHSGRTIPISAASSQPAILQTSVEQSPQVSQTFRNNGMFTLFLYCLWNFMVALNAPKRDSRTKGLLMNIFLGWF